MKLEALQNIVIGGAGLMGASMAQAFAHFGFSVTLYDISEAALEKGKKLIALNQKDWVELGLIGEEASGQLQESLRFTTDRSAFRNCGLVVESIVELARKRGIETVAEGNEAPEQVDFLRSIGCDLVQGYVYARPMPAEELEAWMRARHGGEVTQI